MTKIVEAKSFLDYQISLFHENLRQLLKDFTRENLDRIIKSIQWIENIQGHDTEVNNYYACSKKICLQMDESQTLTVQNPNPRYDYYSVVMAVDKNPVSLENILWKYSERLINIHGKQMEDNDKLMHRN
ncbi:hypothetical protein CAAN1_08S03466 [[Candida] anglica]|uniref:Uncharacterized protein n=1 Tax=[Candida] anglica TaxID=148631 RepID=A0ABP0E7Q4_9ASCO